MYLGLKFRCECGCVSEFNSSTNATKVSCSNCGAVLPQEISEHLLAMLRHANAISDQYTDGFFPTLTLISYGEHAKQILNRTP